MPQSHFSDENSHFLLHFVSRKRKKFTRKQDPLKKPKFFTHRSGMRKGVLSEKATRVKQISESRKNIFQDSRLYFVIKFSDSITSWSSIQSALDSLKGKVTRIFDDNTVKIAIEPESYEHFAEALEKERSLILDVRESNSSEKFDKEFFAKLERNSHKSQEVTIEVSDLSGLTYTTALSNALEKFAQQNNEDIQLGYSSGKFAIFSGSLLPSTIKEIAEQIEVVETIEPLPKIALISYNDPIEDNVELASVISLSRETQKTNTPIVCAIDSGVNKAHVILQGNVAGTYDFTTNSSKPCQDNDGHGSMVSGIVIYGGNISTHTQVISKVLMVKAFEDRKPVAGIMQIIDKATSYFIDKTKVFNLSFSAFGPNRSLSKMLDDLIYSRDLIVVACAGNIDYSSIEHDLKNRMNYPIYLQKHPIYFPGDSVNAITVGASTSISSNWIRKNSPSPFTRIGTDENNIKPDVIFDGGNLHLNNGEDNNTFQFNSRNVGIKSASFDGPTQLSEGVGTSFSSPAIAAIAGNLLAKYNFATPNLIKSLILSSTYVLKSNQREVFGSNIQGFGIPELQTSIQSARWRVCYMLQGTFNGSDPLAIHSYRFLFPNNADRVTMTFVCGKPPGSQGSFKYKLVKSGNKTSSNTRPSCKLGSYPIGSTYKAVYDVKRGGKGEWVVEINPSFDKNVCVDKSMKYGCVITIESSKNLDVYSPISLWMKSEPDRIEKAKKIILVEKETTPQIENPSVISST